MEVLERSDRQVLLRHAARFGPVFKAVAYDVLWVCIVDLATGRRLLRDHAEQLKPVTLALPYVPGGFLRQMQGETHRKYRRAVMHSVLDGDTIAQRAVLESIARDALRDYARSAASNGSSATAYLDTLNAIATGMLLVLFFGVAPGSAPYERLDRGFNELGPHHLVWHVGEREKQAFEAIRACLLELRSARASPPPGAAASILDRALAQDALDETLLGNFIYMVEMGRYDTRGLFRWLSKYTAEQPELLTRMAAEPDRPGAERSFAEAFVLETLRMDQSERLIRLALNDIEFEGYFIPRDTRVRVCLWESHKSEASFPDALKFHPERFLNANFGNDQFAPFGLDQHQCPFGSVVMQTSLSFLRALARGYSITATHEGQPVRGIYVWEPANEFSVRLSARVAASNAG